MKVLVIVDVQKEFDQYIQHDLVDELYDYARKFKQVYQIWDTHKTDIAPTYVFPNQVDAVKKKYGKNHFSDKVTKFIKDKTDETFEGNLFKLSDSEGYIVRVDNNHDWFYVNPEIVELTQKLKNDQVILTGGADNECLEDVYQAFKAFGLNTHINKKYVYSAKTDQNDSVDDNVSEKIRIPKTLSLYEAKRNIKNYEGDYFLVKVNGVGQQKKLLKFLHTINENFDRELFNVHEKFEDLNSQEINQCYWVIPIKEDLKYNFLTVYSSPYHFVNTENFSIMVQSKNLILADMSHSNRVELILNQMLGTTMDATSLYSPRKIKK